MNAATMGTTSYRADIEGLRAIAILLVVAAHVGLPWLAGGFVGVDVFFVLSGYLITSQLATELRNTGRIQLTTFYARRLLRLLPMLLLVIAASCLFGWLLLAPGAMPRQAFSAAYAAVWLSNFHFAFGDLDYFGPAAGDDLFLHTWSLAVEEQFYLFWPLLLLLAARLHLSLRSTLLGVFSLSLAACLLLTAHDTPLAFYLAPTRAWQFALGGLTALCLHPHTTVPHPALRMAGWTGLCLLALAAFWLHESLAYPGLWALLPSLATALLLATGSVLPGQGVAVWLSWPPLQALGHVSYGWYLWHWPVLLLGKAVLQAPSLVDRLGLALFSLLLAAITYRCIEQPVRRNPRFIARPVRTVAVALSLMAVIHLAAIALHNQALQRTLQPEQLRLLTVRNDIAAIYAMGCDDWYHSAAVRVCAFGPEDAEHTAIIIGDSIGLQWFPAAAAVFSRPGWRLLAITKSSCPMVDAPIYNARIQREYHECAQWRQDALRQIVTLRPDIVLLGSTFTYELNRQQWIEGSARIFRTLSTAARSVYVLRSTPVLPFDGPACLAPRSDLYESITNENRCTASVFDARGEAVHNWLQTAASGLGNLTVLDLTESVCPDGLCRAEQNGMVVFRDGQHLTARFAASLAPQLAERLDLNR